MTALCLLAAFAHAANGPIVLGVPGRANATPSIASDGDVVAVAWGATLPSGATDVFVAVSPDGGRAFGAPVRVNDVDGDARLSSEQPPRVTVRAAGLGSPVITVVWTAKGARGTRLIHARSIDGGRTFGKAAAVPGGDAPGNRGWENIARVGPLNNRPGHGTADVDRAIVVWLDHRDLAAQDGEVAASHHEHQAASHAKPDGVAMAQKSKLFVASLDGSVAPRAVTGGVCYCCKTAVAASAGSIYSAWRHVYPGNIRDIAFTVSRDGGRTFAPPVRVSEDKWQLEGCPDDGPAMVVDPGGRIHIVWPTLVGEGDERTIALFYAASDDGKRFTARERVPTDGMPHHPQIAIGADGMPVLAWDESDHGTRRAVVARMAVDRSGARAFARAAVGDRGLYPVIAAVRTAAVVAWTSVVTESSTIRVDRVR